MEQYKKEFIEFMVDSNVLKFGDFVTKSGRKTPFFINTGFYRTGSQLRKLGQYYAKAINENVVSPIQTTANGSLVELNNGQRVFVEGKIVKSGDYVNVNGVKYKVK